MKKRITFILIFSLICSMISVPAAAAEDRNEAAADMLYSLGLFRGTGTDEFGAPIYALEQTATRHEAVAMLVRLLGKGEEAQKGDWNTPFTDVANWAKPYVGYAYANGLASGTSETTFGGNANALIGELRYGIIDHCYWMEGTASRPTNGNDKSRVRSTAVFTEEESAKIVEQLNEWVDRKNNGVDTYQRWEVSAENGLPRLVAE